MKVIKQLILSEGQTALHLKSYPTVAELVAFDTWAIESGIFKYVKIEPYYVVDLFGDIDYPSIQIKKGAPGKIKTLCILKWS